MRTRRSRYNLPRRLIEPLLGTVESLRRRRLRLAGERFGVQRPAFRGIESCHMDDESSTAPGVSQRNGEMSSRYWVMTL